jgi:hypothetical protein
MYIEPSMPTSKNPADQFGGDVWLDPIALPHEPCQTMVVATVRFAPGARPAWHSHENGQYLRVTQGIARFGCATARSSRFTPAKRFTPLPVRSAGTRLPPAASWNTSPCFRAARTSPKPLSGARPSPTMNTRPLNPAPTAVSQEAWAGAPFRHTRTRSIYWPSRGSCRGSRTTCAAGLSPVMALA